MKIEYTKESKADVRYGSLKPGDTFRSDGSVFIVSDTMNSDDDYKSVTLDLGEVTHFSGRDLVEVIVAKVVVEGSEVGN